jgi:hypothetical protein
MVQSHNHDDNMRCSCSLNRTVASECQKGIICSFDIISENPIRAVTFGRDAEFCSPSWIPFPIGRSLHRPGLEGSTTERGVAGTPGLQATVDKIPGVAKLLLPHLHHQTAHFTFKGTSDKNKR